MMLLESWAMARLEAMGVDGVFAPYIVGMLPPHSGRDVNLDDAKFNIHQVLMGWLAPEDEEHAHEFVNELVKLAKNPAQLTDAVSNEDKRIEDDINKLLAHDVELKASAPTFVPHKFEMSEVAEVYPTGSPELSTRGLDGLEARSSPPCAPLSNVHRSEGVGDDDGEQDVEEEVDSSTMQSEDEFFWSVAYELVSHLQLKFPDIDPNRLCDLLRLVGLDVDKAHAVVKATIERESIGLKQVCRHYLQGQCRRADCMVRLSFCQLTDLKEIVLGERALRLSSWLACGCSSCTIRTSSRVAFGCAVRAYKRSIVSLRTTFVNTIRWMGTLWVSATMTAKTRWIKTAHLWTFKPRKCFHRCKASRQALQLLYRRYRKEAIVF